MVSVSDERVSVPSLISRKGSQQKITALTAYDYTMARLVDRGGIDVILVGDSIGTVIQGHENTLPVTLDEIIYHCRCVVRGVQRALVVGDLPFMSYQISPEDALRSAGRLLKEGGVAAVKLEGGVHMATTIERLVSVDIPVMAHVGMTPQSFHRMGGHKVQGRGKNGDAAGSRERILADARAVADAGAFAIVIEGVPADLGAEITAAVSVPTIGIGAGINCDGQILVGPDMLGMITDISPKFVKQYADLGSIVTQAVMDYVSEVRDGQFPTPSHSFGVPPKAPALSNVSTLKRA